MAAHKYTEHDELISLLSVSFREGEGKEEVAAQVNCGT